MRTVIIMKWDGVTPNQYDETRKLVNWEGNPPKGAVFHVSGYDGKAMRVTDIWETPDDYNNFVQTRLMPGVKEAGIKSDPQVELVPVHAIFIPDVKRLT
jgi:hypothetical protein